MSVRLCVFQTAQKSNNVTSLFDALIAKDSNVIINIFVMSCLCVEILQ